LKAVKPVDKFRAAVEYLTDYAGVRGAIIIDSEGLVIIQSPGKGFEGELWAAKGLEMVYQLGKNLRGLTEPGCELLSFKTAGDWITIAKSSVFFLVVLADRKADDLLNVRISRAVEMIAAHIKDKYPAILSESEPAARKAEIKMEASNV